MSETVLPRVLVAGATGQLGRHVVAALRERGAGLRTLSRHPAPAQALRAAEVDVRLADATDAPALAGLCDGIDVVCSCLGASVSPSARDRRGFSEVDVLANHNLLAEAKRSGVRRVVYVSAFLGDGWSGTAYARAHEEVVAEVRGSGLECSIVRPVGLFSVFGEMLALARRGPLPVIGRGEARTNPIHDADVAALCVEAVLSAAPPPEIDCGGPDVLTRRQVTEACFEALGRRGRIVSVPAGLMRFGARAAGLWNPRLGQLLEFGVAVGTHDCVAPVRGRRRLVDFLREHAAPAA